VPVLRKTRSASPATRRIRACRRKVYRGIHNVLGTIERAEEVRRHARKPLSRPELSARDGSENLYHPNDEIGDVIRYFRPAARRYFNVHFPQYPRPSRYFVAEISPTKAMWNFVKALRSTAKSAMKTFDARSLRRMWWCGQRMGARMRIRFRIRLYPRSDPGAKNISSEYSVSAQ